MQILLLSSVFVPLVMVMVFTLIVLIVICAYLKENYKNIKRSFKKKDNVKEFSNFEDPDLEIEKLRLELAEKGQKIKIEEPDGSDSEEIETSRQKMRVLEFYLEMMP
jgi:hypothetical protein